jgi:hypothetical protein
MTPAQISLVFFINNPPYARPLSNRNETIFCFKAEQHPKLVLDVNLTVITENNSL